MKNLQTIIPAKLHEGDNIRIIAPSRSLDILSEETINLAGQHFSERLGLQVTYAEHVRDTDLFSSSSITSRVADLHAAFEDDNVKAIFTAIGGFNCNQLLPYIDWELLRTHPKILCGYSDITALNAAIFAKTGLITYYGPHFSTLGQKHLATYNIDYLRYCLFQDQPYTINPSTEWTDDRWYRDQDSRSPIKNEQPWILNAGSAEGTILGGNLSTISLLQGTGYMPDFQGQAIYFLEEDSEGNADIFDRMLESLLQQKHDHQIAGLVIGRFQKASGVSRAQLSAIINRHSQLRSIPVIANTDFGHTDPMAVWPLGGQATISTDDIPTITVTGH